MNSKDAFGELYHAAAQMLTLKAGMREAFEIWSREGFRHGGDERTGPFCQMLAERICPELAFAVLLRVSPDEAMALLSKHYVGAVESDPVRAHGGAFFVLSGQISEVLTVHGPDWLGQKVLDGTLDLVRVLEPDNASAFQEAFEVNDLDWSAWVERMRARSL